VTIVAFECLGHLSDVDAVCFHPNSNYIATGSSDNSVRVWDVLNGNCVRAFTGHKVSETAASLLRLKILKHILLVLSFEIVSLQKIQH